GFGCEARRPAFAFAAGELPAHGAVLQRDDAVRDAGIAQRLAADDAARAAGAVDHDERFRIGRDVMHTVRELGAGRIDAAGDAHALVFLEGPRVEDDELLPARAQVLQFLGR